MTLSYLFFNKIVHHNLSTTIILRGNSNPWRCYVCYLHACLTLKGSITFQCSNSFMHYLIILYGQKANIVSIYLQLLHYRNHIYYTLTEINFSKLKNERLSNAFLAGMQRNLLVKNLTRRLKYIYRNSFSG